MSLSSPRSLLTLRLNLEHLQKQAKRRVKGTPGLKLAEAQHQIAQEYGAPNWARLARTVRLLSQGSEASARYEVAKKLMKENRAAEALEILLWCFDDGMKSALSLVGVRRSSVLASLKTLGESHPPALQALRDRRDRARIGAATVEGARTDWPDLVALNRVLEEPEASLAFYDEAKTAGGYLPSAHFVLDGLLQARRYPEVVAAKSFEACCDQLALGSEFLKTCGDDEKGMFLRQLVRVAGKTLEALAGVGDLVHAVAVLEKIRALDWTRPTVEILRTHVDRAGHSDLIPVDEWPETRAS